MSSRDDPLPENKHPAGFSAKPTGYEAVLVVRGSVVVRPDRLEHGSDESLVIPWCFTTVESSFDGEQKNESERAVGDDGERHNDDLPGQLEDVCHSSIPSSRPVSGSSGMNGIVT